MLVESPLTLSEITQNSFMIGETGHPFLLDVLQLIAEIVSDVRDKNSVKYPFTKLYHNVFFGKMLHTLSTLLMTGPATLDKAFVRAHLKDDPAYQGQVSLLSHDMFYEGTVAKHHHNGSWFDGYHLLQLLFVVIALGLLGIVLACVLTTFFATRASYHKKYKLV